MITLASLRWLRECSRELAPIVRYLFQQSVDTHTVPCLWKSSCIVPIPKKPRPSQNNDYRLVALTSLMMKCLERLLRRIFTETPHFQDPHQFAYRRNRSTEDAILTLVHHAQKHLDPPKTSARILFLDFSSAFNTIQPYILLQKLGAMFVNPSLRKWIWDFLTDRKQWVKINNTISSTITTNSGAPQGCVSSPALFSVYTSDCNQLTALSARTISSNTRMTRPYSV